MAHGIFITFEGGEGSGKSTHIRAAARFFKKKGRSVLLVREPGSTAVSEDIRQVLLNSKHKGMSKQAELLLYLAARAELVHKRILPALQAGKVVISDRYEDSTFAYQGFGDGISIKTIENISQFVRGKLKPDLTFILDVHPKIGLKRAGRRDRVEKKSDAFHLRVREGFQKLAQKNFKRIVFVRSDISLSEVRDVILRNLREIYR